MALSERPPTHDEQLPVRYAGEVLAAIDAGVLDPWLVLIAGAALGRDMSVGIARLVDGVAAIDGELKAARDLAGGGPVELHAFGCPAGPACWCRI